MPNIKPLSFCHFREVDFLKILLYKYIYGKYMTPGAGPILTPDAKFEQH
jgi:hypothetical protein